MNIHIDRRGQKSSFSGAIGNCLYVRQVGNEIRIYESECASDPGIFISPEQFGAFIAAILTDGIVTYEQGGVRISADSIAGAHGVVLTNRQNYDLFVKGVRAREFDHWCRQGQSVVVPV